MLDGIRLERWTPSPQNTWSASVRIRTEQTVARQIGPNSPEKPETALLKPLRFRRLMEATSDDEHLTAFRRLVGLAGGALNLTDLADALLDWSEWRQRRWVYDYWNAGQPEERTGTLTPAEDTAT